MRTFLVTGGAGFIGSHIATALVERGDRVRILDNLSTGSAHNFNHIADRVDFVEGDIEDSQAVASAVEGVDCVFHQAALASVPRSVEAPLDSHAACVTGTVNVLDQARRAGVRRVVYASSSSLYGDQPTSSKRETDLPAPISPYGAAKLSAEYYCAAFAATYDIETVALRYFNVFGPRQDPDSPYSAVIPIFITAILQDRRPTIYGDGGQARDFTYVANVVEANLLAADTDGVSGQAFNVAGGRSITLLKMFQTLNECLGTDVQPIFDEPRVGDIRESLADISKARAALGYEGHVDFEDGMRRSIDYYRQIHVEKMAQAAQ
jgi:UDP-glucose 4-epimerase